MESPFEVSAAALLNSDLLSSLGEAVAAHLIPVPKGEWDGAERWGWLWGHLLSP